MDAFSIRPADVLVNLIGEPLLSDGKELRLGHALGMVLVGNGKNSDPLRAYVLAKKFSDASVEDTTPSNGLMTMHLDASDLKFIKESIANVQGFSPLVLGQLLEKLQ